jgi:hypothetical protein
MLLMAGVPVYVFMKWRADRVPVPEPVSSLIAPAEVRTPVGVGS